MPSRRQFLTQTAVASVAAAASVQIAVSATKDEARNPVPPTKSYRIPHTDLVVSRLAYGTAMSGTGWRRPDYIARSTSAIQTAYDNGITLFDTADAYAGGQSELALGQFLKKSPGIRNSVVIQSKCGLLVPHGWTAEDSISGENRESFGVDSSRAHILGAVEGSLKRLDTDRIDILLLHLPDALVEPEEVAQAFDELKDHGKVRYFGVSNHNVAQIELLKKYVRQPLVANQVRLGLAHHSPISENSSFGGLVDYCRLHQIQVQAWSPLRGANILNAPSLLNPPADASSEIKHVAKMLADIAKRHDVTAAAVMLAWLLRHPSGIVPIIGASHPQHIVDNCRADRINLSRQEWTALFYAAAAIQ